MRLFFVPKHLVMLITVYQTKTGHRAVSLYNESNEQYKCTFKCWSCHAFNVVHQHSCFCAHCFAIFAYEVVLLIYVLPTFSWNHSPICFVYSLFLHVKHFETSALLCVVNRGILLDIGDNLRYSPLLQISNFPLTKKAVSCVKLVS